MKMFSKGIRQGRRGFTLIELLVVIGIMGVLAAIALPTYARFFGAGTTQAHQTELVNVQAAMDAMMADKLAPDVAALIQANATKTFGALPTVGASTKPVSVLDPVYLRAPTTCSYYWNTAGRVSQDNTIVNDACNPS